MWWQMERWDNDFLSLQGFHTTDGVSEITML